MFKIKIVDNGYELKIKIPEKDEKTNAQLYLEDGSESFFMTTFVYTDNESLLADIKKLLPKHFNKKEKVTALKLVEVKDE